MAQNVVHFQRKEDFSLESAFVKGGDDQNFMVENNRGVFSAKKAFSCLVLPETNDKVLISYSASEAFIMAVLERNSREANVVFPGRTKITADQGNILFQSKETIAMESGRSIELLSPELSLSGTSKSSLTTTELNVDSKQINCRSSKIRLFADHVESVVNTVFQSLRNAVRQVEETETLNAGNLLQTVKKILTIHSHNAVITTRKDLKIDGERIHMG